MHFLIVDDLENQYIPHVPWYGFQDVKHLGVRRQKRNTDNPKIATSVHLLFSKDGYGHEKFENIKRNGWMLENTIVVRKSIPSTYFAVLQIIGVYAGVQELEPKFCNSHTGIHNVKTLELNIPYFSDIHFSIN